VTGFRHPPLARDWIDAEHRRFEIGELPLESGATLRDAFVSYVIHGDTRCERLRASGRRR